MRAYWLAVAAAAVLVPSGLGGQAHPSAGELGQESTSEGIIFLVRHAEVQAGGGSDPGLSREGRERAERLAVALSDVALDRVYTTDYARTRGTAGVVAERSGLEARIYDPERLVTFARAISDLGGRMLIVGHSNTTPGLVRALGGEPGPPIQEAEHDRLYVLFLDDDRVRTVRLRF